MRRAQGKLLLPTRRDGRADRENHDLTEQKPVGPRAGAQTGCHLLFCLCAATGRVKTVI